MWRHMHDEWVFVTNSSQNIFSDVLMAYCDKNESSFLWDSLLVFTSSSPAMVSARKDTNSSYVALWRHSISPSLTTKVLMCPCWIASCTHLGDSRHDKSDRSSEIKVTVHPKLRLFVELGRLCMWWCNLKFQAIVKLSMNPTKKMSSCWTENRGIVERV